jgi:ribosomal protein S18 acetylase RimI-like enzyme
VPEPRRGSGSGADPPDQDTFVVATSGSRILAAATVCHDPEDGEGSAEWWLFGMLVRPRYRGAGVGALLVAEAKRYAAAAGGERLHLLVDRDNRAAVALYRKTGFVSITRPLVDGEAATGQATEATRDQVLMTAMLTPRSETG